MLFAKKAHNETIAVQLYATEMLLQEEQYAGTELEPTEQKHFEVSLIAEKQLRRILDFHPKDCSLCLFL